MVKRRDLSEYIKEYANKGVALCAALKEPSERLEELLLTPPNQVNDEEVKECLRKMATPYIKLQQFEQ